MPRLLLPLALAAALACGLAAQAGRDLWVDAPPALAGAAQRVKEMDPGPLDEALGRAGLRRPSPVDLRLIAEDDPRSRETPSWVAGRAFGDRVIWIFPARVTSYPYDSLESVVRHEITHLALTSAARGGAIPRWFHEGVAVSVDAGWRLGGSLRLLLAVARQPDRTPVATLFESDDEVATGRAYVLSAALVDDLRERHGTAVPGRIARRVADGTPFDRAFALETGVTPDEAASLAWRAYGRWPRWLPLLADPSSLWIGIVLLAFTAFVARAFQRIRQRKVWEREEAESVDEVDPAPGPVEPSPPPV